MDRNKDEQVPSSPNVEASISATFSALQELVTQVKGSRSFLRHNSSFETDSNASEGSIHGRITPCEITSQSYLNVSTDNYSNTELKHVNIKDVSFTSDNDQITHFKQGVVTYLKFDDSYGEKLHTSIIQDNWSDENIENNYDQSLCELNQNDSMNFSDTRSDLWPENSFNKSQENLYESTEINDKPVEKCENGELDDFKSNWNKFVSTNYDENTTEFNYVDFNNLRIKLKLHEDTEQIDKTDSRSGNNYDQEDNDELNDNESTISVDNTLERHILSLSPHDSHIEDNNSDVFQLPDANNENSEYNNHDNNDPSSENTDLFTDHDKKSESSNLEKHASHDYSMECNNSISSELLNNEYKSSENIDLRTNNDKISESSNLVKHISSVSPYNFRSEDNNSDGSNLPNKNDEITDLNISDNHNSDSENIALFTDNDKSSKISISENQDSNETSNLNTLVKQISKSNVEIDNHNYDLNPPANYNNGEIVSLNLSDYLDAAEYPNLNTPNNQHSDLNEENEISKLHPSINADSSDLNTSDNCDTAESSVLNITNGKENTSNYQETNYVVLGYSDLNNTRTDSDIADGADLNITTNEESVDEFYNVADVESQLAITEIEDENNLGNQSDYIDAETLNTYVEQNRQDLSSENTIEEEALEDTEIDLVVSTDSEQNDEEIEHNSESESIDKTLIVRDTVISVSRNSDLNSMANSAVASSTDHASFSDNERKSSDFSGPRKNSTVVHPPCSKSSLSHDITYASNKTSLVNMPRSPHPSPRGYDDISETVLHGLRKIRNRLEDMLKRKKSVTTK